VIAAMHMSWQKGWNEILDEMRPYYKIVRRSRALCVLSPGRACPRDLAAWGAGRPVGPVVEGLVSGMGRLFGVLDDTANMLPNKKDS
jgi:hypothetical protein